MDIKKIDQLLQYALLLAGEEEDPFDRQLGPIHLIKYVYLADLTYAKHNNGETFTGVNWQFYKFGPWAQTVNSRIEPALLSINANKNIFPSDYEDQDEWVRWDATDEKMLSALGRGLPLSIKGALHSYIRKFGKDTYTLLDYVYSTRPMTQAAPNEMLDFTCLIKNVDETEKHSKSIVLTKRQEKKIKEKIREIRSKNKDRLQNRRSKRKLVKPFIQPKYDDVYFDGIEWLDSLAGERIPEGKHGASFDDSLWKSPARRGDDDIS